MRIGSRDYKGRMDQELVSVGRLKQRGIRIAHDDVSGGLATFV